MVSKTFIIFAICCALLGNLVEAYPSPQSDNPCGPPPSGPPPSGPPPSGPPRNAKGPCTPPNGFSPPTTAASG